MRSVAIRDDGPKQESIDIQVGVQESGSIRMLIRSVSSRRSLRLKPDWLSNIKTPHLTSL